MPDFWDQFATVPQRSEAGPNPSGPQAGLPQTAQASSEFAMPQAYPLAGLQGDEFLNALTQKDPSKAAVIKQIGEGRAPYPSGFMMKTPFGQWLVGALGQAYPGMTAQDFQTKLATAKDFAAGKSAQSVKAANQAILHAQTALDASEKLGGFDTLPAVLNPIRNAYESQFDTDYQTNKARYENSVNALAGELTKTFRGSSGALADVEHWRQGALSSASPTTRRASIQSGMELLSGALESLTDQYNRGMKANNEPMDLLAPRNKAAFGKLMGHPPEGTITAGFQGDSGVHSPTAGQATSATPKPGSYRYDPTTRQIVPQ